jgi:hypothetical protein
MKIDEVAKGLEAGNGRRRQPLIDAGLRLAGLSAAASATNSLKIRKNENKSTR